MHHVVQDLEVGRDEALEVAHHLLAAMNSAANVRQEFANISNDEAVDCSWNSN